MPGPRRRGARIASAGGARGRAPPGSPRGEPGTPHRRAHADRRGRAAPGVRSAATRSPGRSRWRRAFLGGEPSEAVVRVSAGADAGGAPGDEPGRVIVGRVLEHATGEAVEDTGHLAVEGVARVVEPPQGFGPTRVVADDVRQAVGMAGVDSAAGAVATVRRVVVKARVTSSPWMRCVVPVGLPRASELMCMRSWLNGLDGPASCVRVTGRGGPSRWAPGRRTGRLSCVRRPAPPPLFAT
jgi:hypothetical protein